MENMFDKAYFGKAYRTRDGRKALYWCFDGNYHRLITADRCDFSPYCENNGKYINIRDKETIQDIVSEWEENIDEEELDRLAEEYSMSNYGYTGSGRYPGIEDFKAGYRTAKKVK